MHRFVTPPPGGACGHTAIPGGLNVKRILFALIVLGLFFHAEITGLLFEQTVVWNRYRPEKREAGMRLEVPCELINIDQNLPGGARGEPFRKVVDWVEFRGCEVLDFIVALGSFRFRVNPPDDVLKGMMDEVSRNMLESRFGLSDQKLTMRPVQVNALPAYRGNGQLAYWGRTHRIETLLVKNGMEFGMVFVLYLDEPVRERFAGRVLASMGFRTPRDGEGGASPSPAPPAPPAAVKAAPAVREMSGETARETVGEGGGGQKPVAEARPAPAPASTPTPPRQSPGATDESPVPERPKTAQGGDFARDPWKLAIDGDLEALSRFHRDGGKLNAPNRFGATPLHYAAFHGHLETARFLIAKGVDIETRDRHGATALHMAAFNGHRLIVLLLLELGSDLSAKNDDGLTPVALARHRRHEQLAVEMAGLP